MFWDTSPRFVRSSSSSPGGLFLPFLEGSDLGFVDGDLLVRCGNVHVNLAVALVLPFPLLGQFPEAGGEVLALPLGIVDIRVLVPEPAFGLLDLPALLLDLLGERRDVGIVKALLDLIDLAGQAVDQPGGLVQLRFEGGKLRGAVLRLLRLAGHCGLDRLFLDRDRIEPAGEFLGEHPEPRNLLVDLVPGRPLRIHLFREPLHAGFERGRFSLEFAKVRANAQDLVVNGGTEPAGSALLLHRAAGHRPAPLDQFAVERDHPVLPDQFPGPFEGIDHDRPPEDDGECTVVLGIVFQQVHCIIDDTGLLERGKLRGFELVERQERDPAEPLVLQVPDCVRRDLVVVADHELELVARRDVQGGEGTRPGPSPSPRWCRARLPSP